MHTTKKTSSLLLGVTFKVKSFQCQHTHIAFIKLQILQMPLYYKCCWFDENIDFSGEISFVFQMWLHPPFLRVLI